MARSRVPPELAAVVFGLTSAASWGAGDFSGGLASRRAPLQAVLAWGQTAGVASIVAVALVAREPLAFSTSLLWASAAGAAGALGLAALYRGLAVGRMGVVAPVSAVLSAAIPVLAGAVVEGVPPWPKLVGFGVALAGIWLVAASEAPGSSGQSGLALALLAGAGFGGFLLLMRVAGEGGTFWPLAAARGTSAVLSTIALATSPVAKVPPRAAWPLVLLSGLLDAGGNAFFVLASQAGRLDVAAVLSSLYPASTVLLAAVFLRERLTRPQGAGVGAVLVAILLIAG